MLEITVPDSLKINQRLKAAKVQESAAREIASIFTELGESHLAAKQDLQTLELRLKSEIEKSKNESIKWTIIWVSALMAAQTGIIISVLKFL